MQLPCKQQGNNLTSGTLQAIPTKSKGCFIALPLFFLSTNPNSPINRSMFSQQLLSNLPATAPCPPSNYSQTSRQPATTPPIQKNLQKTNEIFCRFQEKHYLCTRNQGTNPSVLQIGIWCNGNTTDSGPVILGSSPSIPTKLKTSTPTAVACLFCFPLFPNDIPTTP